jgi:hypothetical protein
MKLFVLFLISISFFGNEVAAQPGQAPIMGQAEFDINGALNPNFLPVSSFAPGPYCATITSGGTMTMSWAGGPNSFVVGLFGPPSTGIYSIPGVGQLDIGSIPITINGPQNIFVFGDGRNFATSFLDAFFFTNPAGVGGISVIVPTLNPGYLTRFQLVINPPGQFFISNAVDLFII